MAKKNHWYQSSLINDALAVGRAVVHGFATISTLGSSMGGYAALRFANQLNADLALAVSPQYSVKPDLIGAFDKRWIADATAIPEWQTDMQRGHTVPNSFVLCDMLYKPDAEHAKMIAATTGATVINFPFSGHPTGFALADLGLVERMLSSRGIADIEELRTRYVDNLDVCATAVTNQMRSSGGEDRSRMVEDVLRRRSLILGSANSQKTLDEWIQKHQAAHSAN